MNTTVSVLIVVGTIALFTVLRVVSFQSQQRRRRSHQDADWLLNNPGHPGQHHGGTHQPGGSHHAGGGHHGGLFGGGEHHGGGGQFGGGGDIGGGHHG